MSIHHSSIDVCLYIASFNAEVFRSVISKFNVGFEARDINLRDMTSSNVSILVWRYHNEPGGNDFVDATSLSVLYMCVWLW